MTVFGPHIRRIRSAAAIVESWASSTHKRSGYTLPVCKTGMSRMLGSASIPMKVTEGKVMRDFLLRRLHSCRAPSTSGSVAACLTSS